jgi:1L-myo-inositol 1-phosphate cytidylyltransferase / CDP-L-myo-inositol myo-inositolphosphotransferase
MATPASNPLTASRSAADVHTLDTAVLLPALTMADEQQAQSTNIDPIGLLTPVGGLPLFLRTVLTLQRAGITNLVVVSGAEEESLKRLLTQDARVVLVVRWMPVREFPLDDPRTWEVLGQDLQGACLMIGAHTVFSGGLIEQVRQHVQMKSSGPRVVVTVCAGDQPVQPESIEMMAVPADLLNGAAWRSVSARRGTPLHLIRAQAAAEGRLYMIPSTVETSQWCQTLRTFTAVRETEQRLLQSPKGLYDGVVDTYFNRKVANRLTGLFVKAGWSPNAITSLSILIGLLAAVLFAQGTYLAGIVGALLFQMSAIVDCCDGDVARLTFQESRFGERLDLIGDNVVHMAIFGALGWAGYANGGGALFLALGILAMVGNGLSVWFVTRMKARDTRQEDITPVQTVRSEFIVKQMANRDFSIVVLFFALVNLLGVFLWLAAIGSQVFWMMTAWITRSPSLRA